MNDIEAISAVVRDKNLRPLASFQTEALQSMVKGLDTFVLAPTGSGKSLCYQLLPSILRQMNSPLAQGTIVVISPLVWLIEDQVSTLGKFDEVALRLASWKSEEAPSFLFLRPEELNRETVNRLQGLRSNGRLLAFVIDEAHCTLNWGDSFREAYGRLKAKLGIFGGIPKMALTATASPDTMRRIAGYLGLEPTFKAIVEPMGRQNIFLSVLGGDQRQGVVMKMLREVKRMSGSPKTVIFMKDRNSVQDLWNFFHSQLPLEKRERVEMYMSTTPERVKKLVANDFKEATSSIRILIATSAFGLGVDCRGLQRVIHLDPPTAFDDFVQQIGRAGRDGEVAVSLLVNSSASKCDEAMKRYLSTTDCRRQFVANQYSLSLPAVPSASCCDCCSK